MLDTRFESIEFLASEHIGAEMARNAGELRYFVVLSGQPASSEFGHLPGHSPIFFDGQGGEKFPKALFGTQRSPVQIRAARLETPGQSLRILRCLTPPKDWRGRGAEISCLQLSWLFRPQKRPPMTSLRPELLTPEPRRRRREPEAGPPLFMTGRQR